MREGERPLRLPDRVKSGGKLLPSQVVDSPEEIVLLRALFALHFHDAVVEFLCVFGGFVFFGVQRVLEADL